jgi:CheY-like chemotaxis protein
MSVTSQVGHGTTFTVLLPLVEATEEQLRELPDENGLSGERLVLADGQQHTILVADDRETNRDVLNGMLVAAGFQTLLASDGDEALQVLRQHPEIALVLMDIKMPRLSGLEAVQQIRSDNHLRHLKVIAVTASVYPGYDQKALKSGFDGFLGKPFRVARLLEEIKKHLHVEFRELPLSESATATDPTQVTASLDVGVPRELVERLSQALSIKNLTAIKSLAGELSARPETAELGERVLALARGFDFEKLDELLQELERHHGER